MNCEFCGQAVDPKAPNVYRRITGWGLVRAAGGSTASKLTVKEDVFAHAYCIDQETNRLKNQPQLLPDQDGPFCKSCHQPISFVRVETEKGWKWMPLERKRCGREPGPGMVAVNPETERGQTVKKGNRADIKRWHEAGKVHLYELHAVRCEAKTKRAA